VANHFQRLDHIVVHPVLIARTKQDVLQALTDYGVIFKLTVSFPAFFKNFHFSASLVVVPT